MSTVALKTETCRPQTAFDWVAVDYNTKAGIKMAQTTWRDTELLTGTDSFSGTISFTVRKSQSDWIEPPICTTVLQHTTAPVPAFCSTGGLLVWLAHAVPTTQFFFYTHH